MDVHHWLLSVLHGTTINVVVIMYNGIMHRITSTVGIDVTMKGCGHNDI